MAEMHAKLIMAMMEHEQSVPQRIQHFLKVWAFTQVLCELEGVDSKTRLIAETAAIVHDIGIKPSLIKHSSSAGKYQEAEGPRLCQVIAGEPRLPKLIKLILSRFPLTFFGFFD